MTNKKLSTIEAESLAKCALKNLPRKLMSYGKEDLPILEEAVRIAWRRRTYARARVIKMRMGHLKP